MVRIFISYSHADEEYRAELEKHLTILKRQGMISVWHDRRIKAGQEFAAEIDSNLLAADLILLLVSSDFLASNYCYDIEMKKALERHEKRAAVVIPIILRACDWKNSLFGKLQATPQDGKPVKQYADLDVAFLEIVESIRKALPEQKQNHQDEDNFNESVVRSSPIRSANVYIKKEFSDEDKDKFLLEAFEYIAAFFQNSLKELCARNKEITENFRRIDANRFTATIYKQGREANRCKIWHAEGMPWGNGIAYAEGGVGDRDNSLNDILSICGDGALLYLHPNMNMTNIEVGQKLTFEGAAEYYWARFIENLQR